MYTDVHLSQRLILGECSWSLQKDAANDAMVPVYENKLIQNLECLGRRTRGCSSFQTRAPLAFSSRL